MEMKYFDLVKPGTTHDFVKYRRLAVTVSLIVNALVLLGVAVWPRLNYGVDFAGGTEMQVHFKKPVDPGEIRDLIVPMLHRIVWVSLHFLDLSPRRCCTK